MTRMATITNNVNANRVLILCFVGSDSLIESIISKILVTNNPRWEKPIRMFAPGQCWVLKTKASTVKHIAIAPATPNDFSRPVDNGFVPINKYIIKKVRKPNPPSEIITPAPGQWNNLKMIPQAKRILEITPKNLLVCCMIMDLVKH